MTEELLRRFKEGQVIIFPTDTLYGIGCSTQNEATIKRLYEIRRTPLTKPSLMLVADLGKAKTYADFDQNAEQIAKAIWPGPLTLVLRAKKTTPEIMKSADNTVALRVPDQPPILSVLRKLKMPIIAPSANFPGDKAPTSFRKIDNKLIGLVDYALDLSKLPSGKPMLKKQSTILDLSKKPFKIIRAGAIPREEIKKFVEVQK